MQGGDGDSPGYGDSGYGNFPNQMWSPQSPQFRGQSSQQRNIVRQPSGFGDYRPNMDAINNPSQHFQSSQFQSSQFQYSQSPLSESDRVTWEQLMGTPETPTSGSVEMEAPTGGGRTGGGGGRGGSGGRRGGREQGPTVGGQGGGGREQLMGTP